MSFEAVTYTPVYIWRGANGNTATFQPVISNAAPPAQMNGDQQAIMGRSLADVRAIFENSLIEER